MDYRVDIIITIRAIIMFNALNILSTNKFVDKQREIIMLKYVIGIWI